jgi:hypothetical protein
VDVVLKVDDLDNKVPADETLTFVFDNKAYVIDLTEGNAQAFRNAVEPWRKAARLLGPHKVSASPPAKPAKPARKTAAKKKPPEVPAEWYKPDPDDSTDVKARKQEYRQRVRTWGNGNGQVRGSRGAIPREVFEAYEEWAAENDVETGPASVGL